MPALMAAMIIFPPGWRSAARHRMKSTGSSSSMRREPALDRAFWRTSSSTAPPRQGEGSARADEAGGCESSRHPGWPPPRTGRPPRCRDRIRTPLPRAHRLDAGHREGSLRRPQRIVDRRHDTTRGRAQAERHVRCGWAAKASARGHQGYLQRSASTSHRTNPARRAKSGSAAAAIGVGFSRVHALHVHHAPRPERHARRPRGENDARRRDRHIEREARHPARRKSARCRGRRSRPTDRLVRAVGGRGVLLPAVHHQGHDPPRCRRGESRGRHGKSSGGGHSSTMAALGLFTWPLAIHGPRLLLTGIAACAPPARCSPSIPPPHRARRRK